MAKIVVMKNITYFIISIFSLLLFSCSNQNLQKVKFAGEAQGTYYVVTYFDAEGRNLQLEIDSLLTAFDQVASMWVKESIISKINRNDLGKVKNQDFKILFEISKAVYSQSGGAFDPTVGPLVNAWGFGFTDRMEVDQQLVDSLLPLVGFKKVDLIGDNLSKADSRIQFDFNAIAQGYSVDLVGDLLESKGITDYLIDIGGEVLAHGAKPSGDYWSVGIEKPKDNAGYGESLQAIVSLNNKALATSGNYRKFYEKDGVKYSHTIDPASGYPVRHSMLSVSVLADDCATADAWATAFMVLGVESALEILAKNKRMDAYFIYSGAEGDLKTYATSGLSEILKDVE